QEAIIPLGSYGSQTNLKIRITGTTGSNWHSDMAIDDFSISGGSGSVPTANFIADITDILINESVSFSDLSAGNPDTWSWVFPGGTPSNSTQQNPTIVYNTTGIYDVSLTVSNSQGTDFIVKNGYITVSAPAPIADFTSDITTVMINESVQFTDLSANNPDNWSWSFPGGSPSSSNEQNPSIVYNTPGNYDVSLTVSNSHGTDIITKNAYITVGSPAPIADFTSDITAVMINESVQFTDLSANNPDTWSWSFPGGSPSTSTQQNPTIAYNTAGIYDVSLTVTNSEGTDVLAKTAYITAAVPAPIANFSADIMTVMINEPVQFTDLSTNNPETWSWSFPGGSPSFSVNQNPVVIYDTPGMYEVSLTVSNAGGSNTKTVNEYITVLAETVGYCDSYSLNFSDEYISVVAIGNIFNVSGGSFYSDFSDLVFNAVSGTSYDISLTAWKSNPSRKESWRVWIDYNADGDYNDPGELIFSTDRKRNAVSGTFTVPPDINNSTKMRVAMAYNETVMDPCEIISFGEVEDYSVSISTPMPQPPVANFIAATTTITEGQNIQFSDLSSNSPTSWQWTFEGGNPAMSTSQNPQIEYITEGTHAVTLTATNAIGSDTHTKLDYVVVTQAGTASYCPSQSNSNELEWIEQVDIGSFSNPVGPSFYTDFTNTVNINLAPGTSNDIILTPHFTGNPQREFWRVWIDFNQDGDFDDADETVFTANNKKTVVTGTLNVPTYAFGETRMRVSMKNGSSPSPCEFFANGEVEDYTVNFNGGGFTSNNLFENDKLFIIPNPNNGNFEVKIKEEIQLGSKVMIFNMSGIQVFSSDINTTSIHLNLNYLEDGVYQLVVISEYEYYYSKLVIR
ncbi:MAG: hypothetical protein C0591_13070, partial [Marinilabiliales bacterium]